LDENGAATKFHKMIRDRLGPNAPDNFEKIEAIVVAAAPSSGRRPKSSMTFRASARLQDLRHQRRETTDSAEKKRISFEIRRQYRKESRAWKTKLLAQHLDEPGRWHELRKLDDKFKGKHVTQQPHPDEFAEMLAKLFQGHADPPIGLPVLSEALFSNEELVAAIKKMNKGKAPDSCGIVAELLLHAPAELTTALLHLYNKVLTTGTRPDSWRSTLFKMPPKTSKAKLPTEFRPIACLMVLYKVFTYLVLGRLESNLESAQPEEQHGFRNDRRIEEHLSTASLVIEKTLMMNIPIWIISVDLSKAFDRVAWPTLWQALGDNGVSAHLVWVLQNLYHQQKGQVAGDWGESNWFDISAGVRQGRVLSPRLFCCVLQWGMQRWRARCRTE